MKHKFTYTAIFYLVLTLTALFPVKATNINCKIEYKTTSDGNWAELTSPSSLSGYSGDKLYVQVTFTEDITTGKDIWATDSYIKYRFYDGNTEASAGSFNVPHIDELDDITGHGYKKQTSFHSETDQYFNIKIDNKDDAPNTIIIPFEITIGDDTPTKTYTFKIEHYKNSDMETADLYGSGDFSINVTKLDFSFSDPTKPVCKENGIIYTFALTPASDANVTCKFKFHKTVASGSPTDNEFTDNQDGTHTLPVSDVNGDLTLVENGVYEVVGTFQNGFKRTKSLFTYTESDYILNPDYTYTVETGKNLGEAVTLTFSPNECLSTASPGSMTITRVGETNDIEKEIPYNSTTGEFSIEQVFFLNDKVTVTIDNVLYDITDYISSNAFNDRKITLTQPLSSETNCERNNIELEFDIDGLIPAHIKEVYIQRRASNSSAFTTLYYTDQESDINALIAPDGNGNYILTYATDKLEYNDYDLTVELVLKSMYEDNSENKQVRHNTSFSVGHENETNAKIKLLQAPVVKLVNDAMSVSIKEPLIDLEANINESGKEGLYSFTSPDFTINEKTILPPSGTFASGDYTITATRISESNICTASKDFKLSIIPNNIQIQETYCYDFDQNNPEARIKVGVKWLENKYTSTDSTKEPFIVAEYSGLQLIYKSNTRKLTALSENPSDDDYESYRFFPHDIYRDFFDTAVSKDLIASFDAEVIMRLNKYHTEETVIYTFEEYMNKEHPGENTNSLSDYYDMTVPGDPNNAKYSDLFVNYCKDIVTDRTTTTKDEVKSQYSASSGYGYSNYKVVYKLENFKYYESETIPVDQTPSEIVVPDTSILLETASLCPVNEAIKLNLSDFKVTNITPGKSGSSLDYFSQDNDNDWHINPSVAQNHVDNENKVSFNFQYTDGRSCPVIKEGSISIDSSYGDPSGRLIGFDRQYCLKSGDIDLEMREGVYTITSVIGAGFDSTGGKWFFSPKEILDSGITGYIQYDLNYLDIDNCPMTKKDSVAVVDSLANTNGTLGIETEFCFGESPVDIKIDKNKYTIDTIHGAGIHQYSSGDYWFNPGDENLNKAKDNTIRIKFTYDDSESCVWSKEEVINIYHKPEAYFEVGHICLGDTIAFNEDSPFDPDNVSKINTWTWNFDDNNELSNQLDTTKKEIPTGMHGGITFGTYKSPGHVYQQADNYTATLVVGTNKGCRDTISHDFTVGSYPIVNFESEGHLVNRDLLLTDASTNLIGRVDTLLWEIIYESGNNTLHTLSGSEIKDNEPDTSIIEIQEAGVNKIIHTAISEYGCSTTDSAVFAAFPVEVLTDSRNMEYNFETPEKPEGWINSKYYAKGSISGWEYLPENSFENTAKGNNGYMWYTGHNAEVNEERGWIETPCFDISNLDFPMISLDIFQSVEPEQDGAVIEYSVDDGHNWYRLGETESGANWYNRKAILTTPESEPGVNIGYQGWSDKQDKWVTARYILDIVKDSVEASATKCVRFRLVYTSDKFAKPDYTGFGFDNFLIGKRKRIVLVEEFINAAFTASELQKDNHNTDLDALNEFVDSHKEEVCDIRYHIESRIYKDPLFDRINWQDNSARASEYGAFSWGPMWVMDGSAIKSRNNRGEPKRELTYGKALEERGLIDPSFDITDVTSELDGHSLKIKAKITPLGNVLDDPYKPEYVVRCAIVQEDYEGHRNVMIDLLPNGPGNTIKHIKADEATAGAPIDVEGSWLPAVRTIDNNFRFIIYVQGLGRYDVVEQVYFEDIDPDKVPQRAVPTGTKDILFADEWALYPNPVKDNISLTTPVGLDEEIIWTIHAINGLRIKQGSFYSNPSGPVEIPASELPEGLYILKLSRPDGTQISRKFTKANR